MGDLGARLTRVLVTGSSGYLGAEVVAALGASGATAVGHDRTTRGDLRDAEVVRRALLDARPDVVVHCAAAVPRSAGGYDDEAAARASLEMVDALVAAAPPYVVFTSSMTVYGADLPMPVTEDTTAPSSAYGHAKLAAEQALLGRDGPGTTVLRLPGLFGGTRTSGLVHALCAAAAGGEVPALPAAPLLWAGMHVADAAAAVVRATLRPPVGDVVLNVGYAGTQSISRLVGLLAALDDRLATSVEHPDFSMDLTRAGDLLGPHPASLDQRVRERVADCRRAHPSSAADAIPD